MNFKGELWYFDGSPCLSPSSHEELLQFEERTPERDVVTHSLEQVEGKRNALHAVVRDLHYRSEPVSSQNKHLEWTALSRYSALLDQLLNVGKKSPSSSLTTQVEKNKAS